jgi:galactokinase
VSWGSAPGRLDVMGGIADYSGSLVLQMPLREQTTVWLVPRPDGCLRAITRVSQVAHQQFFAHHDELVWQGRVSYAHARERLRALPGGDWAAYVVGCLLVLEQERGLPPTGLDVLVDSQVPLGKGVSSSASLEVATLKALQQAFGLAFEGTELPTLAQQAENLVVGAPCGLMDQLAAHFGQRGHLLPIVCQPDLLGPALPLPPELHLVGIDSGVRHAVGGASYGQVRTAAFMGYSLLAHVYHRVPTAYLGPPGAGQRGQLPYHGYLANIAPATFAKTYARFLPERMLGRHFAHRFAQTIDPVTTVEPGVAYPVLAATAHPVHEHARVQAFADLLGQLAQAGPGQYGPLLGQLGQLMYASHQSYSACGLGHPQTDRLVDLVRQHAGQGVYGAKITGGGSGGTVCILAHGEQGLATVRDIHQAYERAHGPVAFFG